MKYALINKDFGIELREDSMPLQDGAIQLTNAEFDGLRCGSLIIENGKIIAVKNWGPK